MLVSSVSAPRGTQTIRFVGEDLLPPMRSVAQSAFSHSDALVSVAEAPSQNDQDSFTISDIPAEGVKLLSEMWDKAKAWKTLYDYGRYSDRLRAEFESRNAPTDAYRVIFDARGRAVLPAAEHLARSEGGRPVASADVNRAYEYSGFIFDFFKEHMGYVLEQPMLHVVNYNDDSRQVGFGNAYFSPMETGLSMMVYGTGDGKIFKSFTSDIGVIAHELGHNFLFGKYGAKFTTMGKPYGQPGAIAEHICDVIAKCVEAQYKGWDDLVDNWFIGADLMVNPNFSLRDMSSPGYAYNDPMLGKDPQVAHMKDFVVTEVDRGGVHLNNGILNRLFAEFSENVGGAVYGTPLEVWLLALEMVGYGTNFFDFAQALRNAARRFGFEKEFLKAAGKVGVLEYIVVADRVVRVDGVEEGAQSLPEESSDTDESFDEAA